jgi:hypothetical protein
MTWFTAVLGLALIVAPFIFGYSTNPNALWSSIILGAVITAVSAYKAFVHDRAEWEYWVAGIVGVVVMVVPFVFGFSTFAVAMWVSIIIGALVAMVEGFQLYAMREQV